MRQQYLRQSSQRRQLTGEVEGDTETFESKDEFQTSFSYLQLFSLSFHSTSIQ